jgi:hypothetical protein
MKASNSLFILLMSLFLGLSSSLFAADAELGTVKLVGVTGNVSIQQSSSNTSHVAEDGQVITQGFTVKTGANSSLVLVFSNGVTVYVGPNTILNLDSFTQLMEGTPVDRPLSEAGEEQGTSKTSLHLITGTIVVKADKLNKDSVFTVRDSHVQTQVDGGATYSQTTSESASIVKVESGKVLTKATGQEQQIEREQGEHVFQDSQYKKSDLPVNLDKELDILNKVAQSNSAPKPVTEEGAKDIADSIAKLPEATPPADEGQQGDTTTPPADDPNDINNAPTFNNPVTGDDVLPPPTDSAQDNEELQPEDVFPGPTPPTPTPPGPTPPPVSVIE